MKQVEILCPCCGKLLLKVSADSVATMICWCRRCRQEKIIKYRATEPVRK